MNARADEALLALLLAVPPVVGTAWLQTLGLAGLPLGRAPWLVFLYAMPPALAVGIAARRELGLRAARGYGLAIALLATGFAWHPPVAMDGQGWARVLAGVALASGAAIAHLAGRVARREPPTSRVEAGTA